MTPTCPHDGTQLAPLEGYPDYWECPTCHRATRLQPSQDMLKAAVGRIKLAAVETSRVAQKGAQRRRPEYTLCYQVKETLELLGYVVKRTGQRRSDFGGQDAGTPDVFAAKPGSPMWLGMEAKVDKGRLSPAQQELVDAGCSVVIRSVQDAVDAVREQFGLIVEEV